MVLLLILPAAAGCGGGTPERTQAGEARADATLRETVERTTPPGWLALSDEGQQLRRDGRFADAIVVFEKAVSQFPDYPDAHDELAHTLYLATRRGHSLDLTTWTERLQQAVTHYTRALALGAGTGTTRPWQELMWLYVDDLRRPADAEQVGRRMVASMPARAEAHDLFAAFLIQQGRGADATRVLIEAERAVTEPPQQLILGDAMLGRSGSVSEGDFATVPAADRVRLADAALRIATQGASSAGSDYAPLFGQLEAAAREARAGAGTAQ